MCQVFLFYDSTLHCISLKLLTWKEKHPDDFDNVLSFKQLISHFWYMPRWEKIWNYKIAYWKSLYSYPSSCFLYWNAYSLNLQIKFWILILLFCSSIRIHVLNIFTNRSHRFFTDVKIFEIMLKKGWKLNWNVKKNC